MFRSVASNFGVYHNLLEVLLRHKLLIRFFDSVDLVRGPKVCISCMSSCDVMWFSSCCWSGNHTLKATIPFAPTRMLCHWCVGVGGWMLTGLHGSLHWSIHWCSYFILGLVFYVPMLYLGDSSCSSRIVLPSFFTQHICLMIHEITKGLNFFASFCLSDSDYKWAKISPLRFRAVFTGRELLGARSHLGEWAGFARFLF